MPCWVVSGGCLGILVAILVWDIYLYNDDRPRNAISQIVIDASRQYPLLPWAIGFVMGSLTLHWFDLPPQ